MPGDRERKTTGEPPSCLARFLLENPVMSEFPAPTPQAPHADPRDGAARNMADIARLFMDGARPTPATGAPKRVGPGDRAQPKAAAAAHSAPPQPPAAPSLPKSQNHAPRNHERCSRSPQKTWELPKAMLGMTGAAGDASWNLLASSASTLAREHATTVCLLGVRDNALVMELMGNESADDAPRLTLGTGLADVQVSRAIFTLRNSVGMWLIAAPDNRTENFARAAVGCHHWLLATSTQSDGVVAAYHQMKQAMAVASPHESVRAFIVGDNESAATVVHTRLRKAFNDFLKKDILLAGVGASMEARAANRIVTIPLKRQDHMAVWTAILEELCATPMTESPLEEDASVELTMAKPADIEAALEQVAAASASLHQSSQVVAAASHAVFDQLSHVLDPEERDALTADLGSLISIPPLKTPLAAPAPSAQVTQPAQPARSSEILPNLPRIATFDIRHHTMPAIPATTTSPATPDVDIQPPPLHTSRGVTLRAFDLPDAEQHDRPSQWQAVERSIRDLVADSVLLDARPPMSWASDCCIAIDANGGLHVWTLYKDGVSWYALREWAAEHRNLLALTRRDLILNRDTDVAVHIVLPLETQTASSSAHNDSAAEVRSLMRIPSKSVFLYRLRGPMERPQGNPRGPDRLKTP